MKITEFFKDTLGLKYRNQRWSWGVVDTEHDRVFLRLWEHDLEGEEGDERILVALDKPVKETKAHPERLEHLAMMSNGLTGYGVLCTAKDSKSADKEIESFQRFRILQLGELVHENDRTYAKVVDRVHISEFLETGE